MYTIIRVLFGVLLVFHGIYNVIKYTAFLELMEKSFRVSNVFGLGFVEAFVSLIPFIQFGFGLFLILGFFTRNVLIFAVLLHAFFMIFLLETGVENIALIQLMFLIISVGLLFKNHYNLNSMDYTRDMFMTL
ncbi:DoxX family membrane protein [Aquimarina sp. TRL1]|uniref:DoxX family protein n=1 Tax=Aquimarina hainanensis TaxID=1578017 RepID=UPI00158DCEAF|nr:DoxX family membrane protein [Aquimarina sp. TRL1]